jgi:hypothetical protein
VERPQKAICDLRAMGKKKNKSSKEGTDADVDATIADFEALNLKGTDVFTAEEREAFAAVKQQLIAGGIDASELRDRDIGIITMIEKLRVERAVEKYKVSRTQKEGRPIHIFGAAARAVPTRLTCHSIP